MTSDVSRRPIVIIVISTIVAVGAVWVIDRWSIPAMLTGIFLGLLLGVVAVLTFPDWFEPPPEGPIAGLRRRQPETEPLRGLRNGVRFGRASVVGQRAETGDAGGESDETEP